MDASIVNQVIEQMSVMPEHLQRRVLAFTESLGAPLWGGVPGSELLKYAGTISPEDLRIIEAAIDAGCERVDAHEW